MTGLFSVRCGSVAAVVLAAGALCLSAPLRAQQSEQQNAQSGQTAQAPAGKPPVNPHADAERGAQREALGFLHYLDQGHYAASYAYTSGLLRAKTGQQQFAADVKKDRAPAGAVVTRKLLNASYATTLQDAPTGQYVVLQYNTDFANKKDAVETLVMSFENGYWRVAGWYLK